MIDYYLRLSEYLLPHLKDDRLRSSAIRMAPSANFSMRRMHPASRRHGKLFRFRVENPKERSDTSPLMIEQRWAAREPGEFRAVAPADVRRFRSTARKPVEETSECVSIEAKIGRELP